MKLIMSGLGITGNRIPDEKEIYSDLVDITRDAEIEANKFLSEGRHESAAVSFILMSQIFSILAGSLFRDKSISQALLSAAETWSIRAKEILATQEKNYNYNANSLERQGRYEESSQFKTKATNIGYESANDEAINVLNEIIHEALASIKMPRENFVRELEDKRSARAEQINLDYDPSSYRFGTIVDEGFNLLKDILLSGKSFSSSDRQKSNVSVSASDIKVQNNYSPAKRSGYYDWEVFLHVTDNVAKEIDSVTYTLHPTFYNPIRTIRNDPTGKYPLKSTGWGEFEIKVDVKLKNNNVVTKYHWLDLGSSGMRYPK